MWSLQYDREVTAYLYSLREGGHQLHAAIKDLAKLDQPWAGALNVPERPNQYEIDAQGHFVGFEVIRADKVIRVIYILSL